MQPFLWGLWGLPEGGRLWRQAATADSGSLAWTLPWSLRAQAILNNLTLHSDEQRVCEKCFADLNFPLLPFSTILTSNPPFTPKHFITSLFQEAGSRMAGRQPAQADPAVCFQLGARWGPQAPGQDGDGKLLSRSASAQGTFVPVFCEFLNYRYSY